MGLYLWEYLANRLPKWNSFFAEFLVICHVLVGQFWPTGRLLLTPELNKASPGLHRALAEPIMCFPLLCLLPLLPPARGALCPSVGQQSVLSSLTQIPNLGSGPGEPGPGQLQWDEADGYSSHSSSRTQGKMYKTCVCHGSYPSALAHTPSWL